MQEGQVVIQISQADGLQAYDIGGKSDPYIELLCGEKARMADYLKMGKGKHPSTFKLHSATTSVRKRTLSPNWDRELHTLLVKCTLAECVVVVRTPALCCCTLPYPDGGRAVACM